MTNHEMTNINASSAMVRSFSGERAKEVFIFCHPQSDGPIAAQTESMYTSLQNLLGGEGGDLDHLVQETVFFRHIGDHFSDFKHIRQEIFGDVSNRSLYPASTWIEQPPWNAKWQIAMSAFALIPHGQNEIGVWNQWIPPSCGCPISDPVSARILSSNGQKYLYAGNIHGFHGDIFDEAYSMFELAEERLRKAGMSFHSVVRTWIFLRHMERDYATLNRARRQFFEHLGIGLRPASTGIEGSPFPKTANFSMSLYAVEPSHLPIQIMSTPTLNEAWMYGSDFSRGIKVTEMNKTALYVSGTASIDEDGHTAHPGDFSSQVERMLINISTLLERQGASLQNLVSGVTYLKQIEDAFTYRQILKKHHIKGFPHAIVKANICRPDLLCEMEAIATLHGK